MQSHGLALRAQGLGDIELAMLLSLMGQENCIIEAPPDHIDTLEERIKDGAQQVFGLTATCVECSKLSDPLELMGAFARPHEEAVSLLRPQLRRASSSKLEQSLNDRLRHSFNVVIAKHFDQALPDVQDQVLQTLREEQAQRRIDSSHTQKPLLFVALLSSASPPLSSSLNDFFFLSYSYDIDGGPDYLDRPSAASSQHPHLSANEHPILSTQDLATLADEARHVHMMIDMKRYVQNLVVFLRMHRAVAHGVSPKASKSFEHLVHCLAALHGLSYVTPSLVALALPKAFRHRIVLVAPEDEWSLQYGGDIRAVGALLRGLTPEMVIQDVLEAVEVPV